MQKKKTKLTTLFNWIWYSYLKTALIPLILIELVFIGIYFSTNFWSQRESTTFLKNEATQELRKIASDQASIISEKLIGVSNAMKVYSYQTKIALTKSATLKPEDSARLKFSPIGTYYTTNNKKSNGVGVFYSGYYKIGQAEIQKVARVLTTENLMKNILDSQPLVSSIYFNTFDSLNVIYPYFDVITQYTQKMNIPSYNFYYEADLAHNPAKVVKWTDAYLDPAGHGWIASAIAPVYNGDFLEGVAGMDVTVSTIASDILSLDLPWNGYGILIGEDGTILALPEAGEKEWGLNELKNHHYSEAILKDTFKPDDFNIYKRSDLKVLSEKLAATKTGITNIVLNNKDLVVSWHTISGPGWKFLAITEEKNIYSSVDKLSAELFKIGQLMILGLVLFYSVFFFILANRSRKMSTNISDALIKINDLVREIGEGKYYHSGMNFDVKELNETSQNVIKMGNELGASNENLLSTQEQLKKREEDLNTLVRSIDDVVIEMNKDSKILKLWTQSKDNLPINYDGNKEYTYEDFLDAKTSKIVKEKMKKVFSSHEAETVEYILETISGIKWFQSKISFVDNEEQVVVVSARDITEIKNLQKSLTDAKEAAERANLAKSQFLSNMSHELRTPLNAILGFSQILKLDNASPLSEEQKQYVGEIMKAGDHLLKLITEILDLAKIESGKLTLNLSSVSVAEIIHDVFNLVKPQADFNQINIVSNFEGCENCYIIADKTRIKQVLINLLSNAIKYSNRGSDVLVNTLCSENYITFSIIDYGCGIPEEKLDTIFEPFYRIDNNKNVEGSGIGLSVVKQLVEIMDGNVRVESTVGVQTCFSIDIPKKML